LDELLAKGYFPIELPPSFTKTRFATFAMINRAVLPSGFRKPKLAKLCKYSLARASSRFRRTLGIPNPLHYFVLCETIVSNWAAIQALLQLSLVAKSTPTRHPQWLALYHRDLQGLNFTTSKHSAAPDTAQ
jgi:hypothetical protein